MSLFIAIKKLYKRKNSKSYYNSEYILTAKEKQILITSGFVVLFPIMIAAILILVN